ncbi:MAG: class I SAM-dependent methyltransferase, partial [Chloroflexota bacterium]|nr:class I SAM-dependent methyltransferase [Chloroflexota bacterium]
MGSSFEEVSEWWDEQAGDAGDYYNRHVILPALLKVLGDVRGRAVLDLGCGNGVSSRVLAREGARVTGVDVSPSLIARARERESLSPLGIAYQVGDAGDLTGLSLGSYAAVTANMVLMDMEDGAGLLKEAGRLLETGGRFVASLLHPC